MSQQNLETLVRFFPTHTTRIFKLVSLAQTLHTHDLPDLTEDVIEKEKKKLWDARNDHLKDINYSYNVTQSFNMVIDKLQCLVNVLWKTPGAFKRDYGEYQRTLATAVIVLTPLAPHLGAELWSRLQQVPGKFCPDEFDFTTSVFHQKWPGLDHSYNLKLIVSELIGHEEDELVKIPIAVWKLPSLTAEEAFDLACHENEIQSKILPHNYTYWLKKEENHSANLIFLLKRSRKEVVEILKSMKKRKKEKIKRQRENQKNKRKATEL